jgi:pimeloyl-ACP methyl ester carboxylesterase
MSELLQVACALRRFVAHRVGDDSYAGERFAESMPYVRAYPQDLPVMRDLLSTIQTPVQIIAGARDHVVPPVNAEYLHERLPNSKLDLLDTGHFTWEDGADQCAALFTSWWAGGYATAGSSPGK